MSKDPRDNYGTPLEDPKQKRIIGITGTTAKVLQTIATKEVVSYPSPSSQNRFTPLLLATPTLSPRPRSQLLLPVVSSSSKMIQETFTPIQTQRPTLKTSEKLPFYTPPSLQAPCPFKDKPYKLPLFTLDPEYCQNNGSLLQVISKYYPPGFHFKHKAREKNRTFYEFFSC